jgi:hypothetical protein
MAKRETKLWPKERPNHGQKRDQTMTKRETKLWPKERPNHDQKRDQTMAKRKRTNTQLLNTTQKTKD